MADKPRESIPSVTPASPPHEPPPPDRMTPGSSYTQKSPGWGLGGPDWLGRVAQGAWLVSGGLVVSAVYWMRARWRNRGKPPRAV